MFVQIISKNNIDNLFAIDEYQKSALVVFYQVNETRELKRYLAKIKEKYGNGIQLISKKYQTYNDLVQQIKDLEPKYFQFNDLKIAESLSVLSGLNRTTTEIVFFNSNTMDLITYQKDSIDLKKMERRKIDVNDYIELAGGDIEMKNDVIFDRLIDDGSFEMIMSEFKYWRKFSRAFVDSNIVYENETRPLVFTVKFKGVETRLAKHFRKFVDHFVEKGYFLVIAENMNRTIYRYSDMAMKSFFKLSGSWLELLTYKAVKDLKLDDIDASVLFTWNHHIKNFENEIDLLATQNGKLIMISCKDTKKVNKDYLNEIIVNSNELANDNVTKALVTTSKEIHESFLIRANELDISIIGFDGNFPNFKEKLRKILK